MQCVYIKIGPLSFQKREGPNWEPLQRLWKLSRNFVDPSSAHVSAGGGHSLGANLWIVIIMAWLLIVIMGTYTCIYTAGTWCLLTLYCTALYCTHCTVPVYIYTSPRDASWHCTVQYCSVLYCTVLYCTKLYMCIYTAATWCLVTRSTCHKQMVSRA